jgi:ABC-type uncharacterized transport system YnjBCD ATPase subunit
MNVSRVLYGCAVDDSADTVDTRSERMAAQLRQAQARARISATRLLVAIGRVSLEELALAADTASRDAARLVVFARHHTPEPRDAHADSPDTAPA